MYKKDKPKETIEKDLKMIPISDMKINQSYVMYNPDIIDPSGGFSGIFTVNKRTKGTDYYLGSLLTLVNLSRLQETMKQMVVTILTIFGLIVVGDLIIW